MLQQAGYNTGAFGKWHVAPMADGSAVGPFNNWPLGKGFERYYGFLDALTDQFAPSSSSITATSPRRPTRTTT